MQGCLVQADDVLDLVDGERVVFAAVFEGDGGFVFSERKDFLSEACAQIDEGEDSSSDIDESANCFVRSRHGREFFDVDDIADLFHGCGEELSVDLKGYMLLSVEGCCGCKGVLRDTALQQRVLSDIGHDTEWLALRDGVQRLGGDHGVEHGNGEEGVDARKEHGTPCAASFECGRFCRNDSQRDFLARPDDEPDIEGHDDSQPHADTDGGVSYVGLGSEVDERFEEVSVEGSEDDSCCQRCKRRPSEPEERCGGDDLCDGGFLFVGDVGHGGNLYEVEVPQQSDPHDAACDMGPAEEEGDVFAAFSADVSELREQECK